VIDRSVEHEGPDAGRQLVDPRPVEVLAAIDLAGGGAAEPAHVVGGGVAPEVTRQGRLGDAEVGRAAAILWVVHEAALAPDHVVDHLVDGWGHVHTRDEGTCSYITGRGECKS
jgi:hypothetical protein